MNGTQAIAKVCDQLLHYVTITTHPNAGICYKACDMILVIHTNASYLSEAGGKSRTSAHLYLTNHNDEIFNNSAILNLSSSSNTSCHLHPKPNSLHYIMDANSRSLLAPHIKRWDIRNTNAPW